MDDRKMFAPLHRNEGMSLESKLVAVLRTHQGGAMPATLADDLFRAGLAVGTRAPVATRIGEILDELEQAGRIERIPDGRYRAPSTPPSRG